MQDNLFIGPDAHSRFTLQMLRAHEGVGKIAGGKCPVIDNVFLSTDGEGGVKGTYRCDALNMINIQMRSSSVPRWQALHIELGNMNLSNAAAFGVVARSVAPSSLTTRLCIRSGNGDQFVDTFMPKTMVSFAQASTHLDVMDLGSTADLPKQAQWRDLILFFRAGDVSLDLLDLRLFVV